MKQSRLSSNRLRSVKKKWKRLRNNNKNSSNQTKIPSKKNRKANKVSLKMTYPSKRR